MQEVFQSLSKFATPEVITVFGALAFAWVGWKATSKMASLGGSLVGSLAQKAGFLGVTAAILFITGLGTTGVGVGELVCRATNSPSASKDKGVPDVTLTALAEKCHDNEMAKLILDYARVRDGDVGSEDVRILQRLIEKQMGQTKNDQDREANAKTLTVFIDYLSKRESNRGKEDKADKYTNTSFVSTTGEEPKKGILPAIQAAFTNRDSVLSLPWSIGLIGLGLASSISGVVCHRVSRSPSKAA